MNDESVLIGISQLGAVFAGFIAIFMVFVRKDGRLSAADSLRVRSIIHSSVIVVLAPFLPILLSANGVSNVVLWKASAAIFMVLGLSGSVDVARHHIAMTRQDRTEVGRVHSIVSWGLNAIVSAVLILIALGYGDYGHYILALVLTLAIATSNFITISLQKLL